MMRMLGEATIAAAAVGAVAMTVAPDSAGSVATGAQSAAEWAAGLLGTDPDAILEGADTIVEGGLPSWVVIPLIGLVTLRRSINEMLTTLTRFLDDFLRAQRGLAPQQRDED